MPEFKYALKKVGEKRVRLELSDLSCWTVTVGFSSAEARHHV